MGHTRLFWWGIPGFSGGAYPALLVGHTLALVVGPTRLLCWGIPGSSGEAYPALLLGHTLALLVGIPCSLGWGTPGSSGGPLALWVGVPKSCQLLVSCHKKFHHPSRIEKGYENLRFWFPRFWVESLRCPRILTRKPHLSESTH